MTLEELLNKLIEKGWKPYRTLGKAKNSVYTNKYFFFEGCADGVTLRQIVSKESGLWQFVCENGMINGRNTRRENHNINSGAFMIFRKKDYEYRLIETSLKNEDELEQFLLDNIIINEQA